MASTGTIEFRVFTSSANLPVEGATVIVRKQEPPSDLLGILVTDESGRTRPLEIDAPDISLGQTPDDQVTPWIPLRVLIEHPGYEEVSLSGVQLFPNTLTVQNVQMIPDQYLELGENDLVEFNTTPQPIWGGDQP